MTQEDYTIGVWDVELDLNVSNESIIQACKKDAPTCTMVFDMHNHGKRTTQANTHTGGYCRLCHMVELFANRVLEVPNHKMISYNGGDPYE